MPAGATRKPRVTTSTVSREWRRFPIDAGTDWVYRDAFRSRSEYGSDRKLAKELVDLHNRRGRTYNKREELHKRAELNRAFAHFRR